jgi:hypothetical protein
MDEKGAKCIAENGDALSSDSVVIVITGSPKLTEISSDLLSVDATETASDVTTNGREVGTNRSPKVNVGLDGIETSGTEISGEATSS